MGHFCVLLLYSYDNLTFIKNILVPNISRIFSTLFVSSLARSRYFYCCCLVTKLFLTLCDPMDCSPLGSSVHGLSQARLLEDSHFLLRGIFLTRDQTCVSCIAGRFFIAEPLEKFSYLLHYPSLTISLLNFTLAPCAT